MKKTREGAEKFKKDDEEALSCESGMLVPGVLEDELQGGNTVEEGQSGQGGNKRGGWKRRGSEKQRLSCKHCRRATHLRITGKDCPRNPNLNWGEVLAGETCPSEMKSWERHTLPVQPNHARPSSRARMCVDNAGDGIRAIGTSSGTRLLWMSATKQRTRTRQKQRILKRV
jgi:hypothetical protein